jgi:Luciferase-like monooxygenase/Double zinc ribbon
MRCLACGFENASGVKFCGECGTPLKLRCSDCGFENAPGIKFCGECGAALGTVFEELAPSSEMLLENMKRVLLGIGGGWNAEEMENHGTVFKTRWKLLRERVEAMKGIWQNEAASYRGELVHFDPISSYPKPVQKPHPPILLGGHGEAALKRVATYCDGWLPISMMAGDLAKGIADLRRFAQEKGRDPKSISVSVFWAPADRAAIDGYTKLGVERVIFALPPESREKVLPIIDQYAKLVA